MRALGRQCAAVSATSRRMRLAPHMLPGPRGSKPSWCLKRPSWREVSPLTMRSAAWCAPLQGGCRDAVVQERAHVQMPRFAWCCVPERGEGLMLMLCALTCPRLTMPAAAPGLQSRLPPAPHAIGLAPTSPRGATGGDRESPTPVPSSTHPDGGSSAASMSSAPPAPLAPKLSPGRPSRSAGLSRRERRGACPASARAANSTSSAPNARGAAIKRSTCYESYNDARKKCVSGVGPRKAAQRSKIAADSKLLPGDAIVY